MSIGTKNLNFHALIGSKCWADFVRALKTTHTARYLCWKCSCQTNPCNWFIHICPWIDEYGYFKFLYMGINGLPNNTHLLNEYYWVTHQIQLTYLGLFSSKSPLFPYPFFFSKFLFCHDINYFCLIIIIIVGFILSFYFLLVC